MSLGADTFKRNSKMTQKRAKSRVLAAACVLAAALSGKSPANEANDALLAADRAVVAQAVETVENEARRLAAGEVQTPSESKGMDFVGVRLTVAVSMSLEKDYRERLRREADLARLRLAVRGLPVSEGFEKAAYFGAPAEDRNRQKAEIVRAAARLHEAFGAVDVDPAFFRENGIASVPVFVLEDGAGVLARVQGAVTTNYALETLYREFDDPSSAISKAAGKVRASEAQKAIHAMGCALQRDAWFEPSFMGKACD